MWKCSCLLLKIITYLCLEIASVLSRGKEKNIHVFFFFLSSFFQFVAFYQISNWTHKCQYCLLCSEKHLAILASPSWRAFSFTTTLRLIGLWDGKGEHNGNRFHACLLHHSPSGHFHQNPGTYFITKGEWGSFQEAGQNKVASRWHCRISVCGTSHISIPRVHLLLFSSPLPLPQSPERRTDLPAVAHAARWSEKTGPTSWTKAPTI